MAADALLVGVSTSTAIARLWSEVDPQSPIEARVGALTEKVEQLKGWLTAAENNIDSLTRELPDALRREQQARAEHDETLQAKLEAAETGGLHISLMGVICLFVGLLLTSVPKEIAQLLH